MQRNSLKLGLAITSSLVAMSLGVVSASAAAPSLVRLATASTTDHWDMTPGNSPTVVNLQRLLCDGLYDLPATSTVPMPAIAVNNGVWGPTSVTFEIRPGLHFSDGSPVTAHDVQASFQRLLSFDRGDLLYPYYLDVVTGAYDFVWNHGADAAITMPDATHVTIEMYPIDRAFTEVLAWSSSCIVKADAFLTHTALPPPTTGPYMVTSTSASQVVLDRNPYWGDTAGNATVLGRGAELATSWQPDRFTVDRNVQEGAQRAAITAGTLDASLDMLADPGSDPQLAGRIARTGDGSVVFLQLNTAKGNPLANRNLRKAIAYAIDRTKLLRVARAAGAYGATAWANLLPPAFGPRGPFGLTANKAKAKAALHAAHLKKMPKIVYVYSTNSKVQIATAKEFKAEMKAVGVPITLKGAANHYDLMNNPAKWSISPDAWYADFPDASEILRQELSFTGAYDWSGYTGLDSRLATIAAMPLGPAREAAAQALATTVLRDDVPLLAVRTYNNVTYWSSHLTNVVYTPGVGIRWELVQVAQ